MIVAYLIFVFIALLTILGSQMFNKIKSVYIFIPLMMIYQIVFQSYGSDYEVYVDFYSSVENLLDVAKGNAYFFNNHWTNFEIGYKLLNSLFKIFFDSIEPMLIFLNLALLIILFKFIKKTSINIVYILLPYFAFVYVGLQMVMIRQFIAVIIFILSTEYIKQKNIKKYMLFILVAMLFHRSSVILIPLYFILDRNYKFKTIIGIFAISLTFYLFRIDVFSNLLLGIEIFFSPFSLAETLVRKIHYYSNNTIMNNYLGIGFLENCLVFVAILIAKKNLVHVNSFNKFDNVFFNISILDIIIQLFLFSQTSTLLRITYFFIVFRFFIIGKFIMMKKNHSEKILYILLLILYSFIMMFIKSEHFNI